MTERDIKQLWKSLAGIYGRKFINDHGISDKHNIWLHTLQHLPPQAIAIGVERCEREVAIKVRQKETVWPPESAQVFKAMCFPDENDFGLPTAEQAYKLAVNRDWSSHPIVYLAAQEVGAYTLRTQAQERTEKKFKKAYEGFVRRVMDGEEFTLPDHAGPDRQLPHKPKETKEQEKQRRTRVADGLRQHMNNLEAKGKI